MLWQLFPSYLIITIVAVLAVSRYSLSELRDFYISQLQDNLEIRANLVDSKIAGLIDAEHVAAVDSICDMLGRLTDTRITVMLPSGQVIGDSEKNPRRVENHADRPEMIQAMTGQIGTSERFSSTLDQTLMYLAIPIRDSTGIAGVVRTSLPMTEVEEQLIEIRNNVIVAGLAVALLGGLISLYISRRLSRPIEGLTMEVDRFARGEFDTRIRTDGSREVNKLARSMNRMATELDRQIRDITNQRNLQEAILESMSESVIAIDMKEKVININHAAAGLLRLDVDKSIGRKVHEVVRNTDLQKLVSDTLAAREARMREIVLRYESERYIEGHGTPLNDSDGNRIGALLVLNDVTRLKKLEGIRKDFVANVSHELKTPITSIKGFVETLLDDPFEDLDEVRRFLRIVGRHADRLDSIIEDLLSLSRIEQEAEKTGLSLLENSLCDVIVSAAQICELNAEAKGIEIAIDCYENLTARINPPLLEQAIVNLIENAIKYSEENTLVRISVEREGKYLKVSVADNGIGIAPEDIGRVFERFYRVDKARSRKLGGTGLGLAIVKHIAIAHRGRVSVQSEPGKGSTFTIEIPALESG